MLTEGELTARTINAEVAREAFQQAGIMLADVLDNRVAIERRALMLLIGYLPSTGVVWAGASGSPVGKAALIFAALGVLLLLAVFRGTTYPSRGTSPRAWINAGIIDGSESALAHTLAHFARHMADRIDLGIAANGKKLRLINAALVCGACSVMVLVALQVMR